MDISQTVRLYNSLEIIRIIVELTSNNSFYIQAGMGSFLIVTAASVIALVVTLQGNSVDAKKNSKNLSSDL